MRLLTLLSVVISLLFSGCHSGPEKISASKAHQTTGEAWGPDFESGHYDMLRTLSPDEQKQLDDELSKKAGRPLHSQGNVFTTNATPDRVVDEVRKLQPGCVLSLCRTWYVEKRSGDVIESGHTKPGKPVPFAVISRDRDGKLHGSRLEASSHEEALSHR
ncbi:MAG: hypothetical protein ACAI25_00230 [Planctomycetota bacterium]